MNEIKIMCLKYIMVFIYRYKDTKIIFSFLLKFASQHEIKSIYALTILVESIHLFKL
jgi:hypothetical protein